jgi:hypothetical protein
VPPLTPSGDTGLRASAARLRQKSRIEPPKAYYRSPVPPRNSSGPPKDNFKADREVGNRLIAAAQSAPVQTRENRAFPGRAVRYLAEQAGIRQFLDIGTRILALGNTHEVAQATASDSRIVYVDNDRFKPGCAHARSVRLG